MADNIKEKVDPAAKVWIDAITAYERQFKKWEMRSEKIVKKYRDYDAQESSKAGTAAFNILWSNVQVSLPAVFARLPKPDVSRRFRDNDPVGRVASLLLERGLDYEVDHYPDYRAAMEGCVLDRFLGGRGQAWVRYEPHISAVPGQPDEGVQITDDADEADTGPVDEEIEYECAPVDYVHWKDFGHTVARSWEEVTAVWRRVYMTREKLVERFGQELGGSISLDTKPDTSGNGTTNQAFGGDVTTHQALIYEIWDKVKCEAVWFSKSQQKVLDTKPDPLGLANFWPCPRPLFSTITNDSLVPVPDYKYYQDQANQLTKLQAKIDGLIEMLQVKGVYDSAIPELARLFKEAGNGNLIPVKNWQNFSEKVGLKGSIDVFDISPIVSALNEAYDTVEKVKNQIYELMGISDIARGASDPTETFGAQKLKGQYGNMRLRNQQERVTRFATELLQIKAQIMCQHFQPQTLARIAAVEQMDPADQALVPQAMQLLMGERAVDPGADTKDGPLAGFRVEVSSDSMIQMDEAQEKADRAEFLTAVGGFLEKSLPIIQSSPQAAPLIVGLLKFGVTGFKVGKTVEGMLDNTLDQLVKQAAQPQPEKPDPEMAKVQAQSQAKQAEMQQKAQLDSQHLQAEAQLELSRQQSQAKEEQFRNQLEAQREAQQQQFEQHMEAQRVASDERLQAMQNQIAVLIAHLNNAAKVEVAEVAAQTTLEAAQISAANSAAQGEP
jgi:hypothetical protein